MMMAEPSTDLLPTLQPSEQQALRRAILDLEDQNFASQLADYAGRPIDRVMRLMPKAASRRINKAVELAVLNCLNVAITSIEPQSKAAPAQRFSSFLAGLSGGVSGFFGLAALPIELPVTTTLMLRAIADIARHHGEDLSTLEARLACVEVFALGAPKTGRRVDFGYYATRTLLSRLAANASALLIERSATNLSAPVVGSLVTEIATRFQRRRLGALGGERDPGPGRSRRRYRQHDFHESFPAGRQRPLCHQAARAALRAGRGAPALHRACAVAADAALAAA